MTKEELELLQKQVGDQATSAIAKAVEPLQKKVDELEIKANRGEDITKNIADIKKQFEEVSADTEKTLKSQGVIIKDLREKLDRDKEVSGEGDILKLLQNLQPEIDKVFKSGAGEVVIKAGYQVGKNGKYQLTAKREIPQNEFDNNKAADVHNTTTIGANASITQSLTTAALLRIGVDSAEIETLQRSTPWILDFVSVGVTLTPYLTWIDEVPKQGNFAITSEGAIKPLLMYSFERKSSDYKKATGYVKITEEFNNDLPRVVSTIKDLMQIDCKNVMNDQILVDMIANASPYSNPVLSGQIDNADNYAAMASVGGQLGNFYYTPNILALNNNQSIVSSTTKGTDGQYINPTPVLDEINRLGLKVIKHPSIAFNKFFMGDGSVYKVLLKGDIIIRIGFPNDDFLKNQFSLLVEQYYYSYISSARKTGLVYGDFSAIKALIEKP